MHTTLQGNTGMITTLGLIQTLSYHGEPLTITIPYKGLMLSQDLRLLHTGEDYAVLQAPNERICAGLHDHVFIHSKSITQKIVAKIIEVNPQRGWIIISDLVTSTNPWQERRHDRVQPSQPLRVAICCGSTSCAGTLDNLSLHGAGVLVYKFEEHPIKAKVGNPVQITFKLPNDKLPVKLNGKIVNFHFISQILSKVGVETQLSARQEFLVKQYIQMRKMNILTEVDNRWILVQEPRSTKDLFF